MSWYHGGDLEKGKAKGQYLYVTDSYKFAMLHAKEDGTDKVYCLRSEYHHLVIDHPSDLPGIPEVMKRKVILQAELLTNGGVHSIFQEVKG